MLIADWSKLPKELLQIISEKLNCEFHELRFRSVCSSWRSSSIPPKNHLLNLPSKFPYPSKNNNNTSTYPIFKRTIFLINPPPNQQQQQTLNPWLIKIGLDSRGRTSLWNPLSRDKQLRLRFQLPHYFDFNQLSLFKLGHEFVIGDFPSVYPNESYSTENSHFMKKVVAYDDTLNSGNDRSCSVLLTIHISGKLAIFRSGDQQWMIMPEMPPNPYTDVCVFNGRPIAVDSAGRTVVVGSDLSLDLVAEAVFGGDTKYLVESDGELLLVDKYSNRVGQFRQFRQFERSDYEQSDLFSFGADDERDYVIGIERAVRFDVFRLDENDKKWVKLTNLGDRVLFLGKDCAFSVKASNLPMANGNCLIFRDDDYGRDLHSTGLGIDVFCLDKQQILPLSSLPRCSNLFWPPPQWTGLD
ncbi:F-box family protein [Trifolium pratense]|uniref:F-box family protein n=1 Tax=Trifolium pratense TaxID=57577 RepID=A0A2K3NXH2_TRIPR|nr:F-box family protein [Trifolium pratense]